MEEFLSYCASLQSLDDIIEPITRQFWKYAGKTQNSDPHSSNYSLLPDRLIGQDENIAILCHLWGTKYDVRPEEVQKKTQPKHLHNHNFYEINYVYRGQVINHFEDSTLQQRPQQILLMNPYAFHRPEICGKDTLLFNLMIRQEFSVDVLSDPTLHNANLINIFLNSTLGTSPLQPYLVFECTPQIKLVLHQMVREFYLHELNYQQILYSKFVELCTLFSRQRRQMHLEKNNQESYSDEVNSILLYIRDHHLNKNQVEMAKEFGFSTNYLSKYIKKFTGYGYNEIIQNFKMQRAVSYLLHSSFTLEEISEYVGYNDVGYFSKVFKKRFDVSPSQYRKQYQSIKHA